MACFSRSVGIYEEKYVLSSVDKRKEAINEGSLMAKANVLLALHVRVLLKGEKCLE